MPLVEKGVRGKGRQPLSPPSTQRPRSAMSAPVADSFGHPRGKLAIFRCLDLGGSCPPFFSPPSR